MEMQKWAYLGLSIGILLFFLLLILNSLEGIICIIMAIPLIIPFILLGIWTKTYLIKKGIIKPSNQLNSLFFPLFLALIGAPIEKYIHPTDVEVIEVKTEKIFPFTSELVYNTIKSVDTLIADKPFLMKIDLPIPNKCILENEAVGGIRTCYFSGGTITEKITELQKAKVLRMDVIDDNLMGSKWLGFKEAIYYFETVGSDSCKLTRITTYTSKLYPRIYWKPLEKIGIGQEHEYVFRNLENDLNKKFAK